MFIQMAYAKHFLGCYKMTWL